MSISRRALLVAFAAVPSVARAATAPEIKLLQLVVRQPGASHDAFAQSWRTHAAGAKAALGGLIALNLEDIAPGPPRPDINGLAIGAEIDGIAEFVFRTQDDARAAFTDARGRAWLHDQTGFISGSRTLLLQDDIIVPVATPRPKLRNFALVARKPGMDTTTFLHDWHKVHGDLAIHVPYLKGFVLGDTIGDLDTAFTAAGLVTIPADPVGGVAQAYFDSVDDQTRMRATPEAKIWFQQGAATFGRIKSYNATEIFAAPMG